MLAFEAEECFFLGKLQPRGWFRSRLQFFSFLQTSHFKSTPSGIYLEFATGDEVHLISIQLYLTNLVWLHVFFFFFLIEVKCT